MKVAVTGSNGLLGQTLLDLLIPNSKYQVFGLSRGENRYPNSKFTYKSVDLTNKVEVIAILEKIQPDFIINTAAMTHVDVCDSNRDACDLINFKFVSWLAEFCEVTKAHLIHISTDFVFDGKNGLYSENDEVNPISYYGLSKVKSEEVLQKSEAKFTILRTILVYGLVRDMSRTNIVLWVVNTLKKHKPIQVVYDQYRMPTYAKSLAKACEQVLETHKTGIFNISSNRLMSVYQIAIKVAQVFNLDPKLITPVSSSELNQPANRPPKTGFYLKKAKKELNFRDKSFGEELLDFKEEYQNYF